MRRPIGSTMRTIASRYIALATASMRAVRECGTLTLAVMAAAWIAMHAVAADAEITSVTPSSSLTYSFDPRSGINGGA